MALTEGQWLPELAYSWANNEFLVAFGDQRKVTDPDVYCQRLWVDSDTTMIWLGDDGITPISPSDNIPIAASDKDEWPMVGVAYSPVRDEFIVVYTYQDTSLHRSSDIYARRYAGTKTAIHSEQPIGIPESFELYQNYPNPFNPQTAIRYSLPRTDYVILEVFDINGRKIVTLVNDIQQAGSHEIVWNAKDKNGKDLASGIYLYRFNTTSSLKTKKMTLLR
jgi:hypothetical protein